ncbi:MAG: hypothetical protein RI909_1168 [Bacteroidota bacterium]
MKWNELQDYPMDRKVRILYEEATFIMAIRYYKHKINLYLLGNEYVEVFVDHKNSSIDRISILDIRHSRMKFYFDQIKLPSTT